MNLINNRSLTQTRNNGIVKQYTLNTCGVSQCRGITQNVVWISIGATNKNTTEAQKPRGGERDRHVGIVALISSSQSRAPEQRQGQNQYSHLPVGGVSWVVTTSIVDWTVFLCVFLLTVCCVTMLLSHSFSLRHLVHFLFPLYPHLLHVCLFFQACGS